MKRKALSLFISVLLFLLQITPVQAAANDVSLQIVDNTTFTFICAATPSNPNACLNRVFTAGHVYSVYVTSQNGSATPVKVADVILANTNTAWSSVTPWVSYTGAVPTCVYTNTSTRLQYHCDSGATERILSLGFNATATSVTDNSGKGAIQKIGFSASSVNMSYTTP